MSVPLSLRARQGKTLESGRYLYLYNNVQTNQIVYSLSRALNNTSVLKQLTYYGKNTRPRSLRKDAWRPFATVRFPKPEHGFTAMQKLREYRKLRDHFWTWKPTESELEVAKTQLEADGIAPKFDLRLPTKKDRAKLLMDQRAYSVADLADIIGRESQRLAEFAAAEKAIVDAAAAEKAADWQSILDLAAQARAGKTEELEEHIEKRREHMERTPLEKNKAKTKSGIMVLTVQLNEMLRAREAVDFVEGTGVTLGRRRKWSKTLQAMVQERTDREVVPPSAVEVETLTKAGGEGSTVGKKDKKLSSATDDAKATAAAIQVAQTSPSQSNPSVTKPSRREQRLAEKKAFREARLALKRKDASSREEIPTDAILIQWMNLADAEYAAEWPEHVYHEWMGHTSGSHTAPFAGNTPMVDLELKPIGDLTEEEKETMEKGVDLDGESSEEGGEDDKGESEKGEDGEGGKGEDEKKAGWFGGFRKLVGGGKETRTSAGSEMKPY